MVLIVEAEASGGLVTERRRLVTERQNGTADRVARTRLTERKSKMGGTGLVHHVGEVGAWTIFTELVTRSLRETAWSACEFLLVMFNGKYRRWKSCLVLYRC